MFVVKFLFIATAAFKLGSGSGEVEQCNCKDPTYTSSWGQFTPTSRCAGKCNGMQLGLQECYSSLNGVILPKSSCHVERICPLPESCKGTWALWSNTQRCLRTCEQEQTRFCYKTGTFIRNNFCLGSEPGLSEQRRRQRCFDGACDPDSILEVSTTTSRSSTTSTTTRRTNSTESTSPLGGGMTTFYAATTNNSFTNEDVPAATGSGRVEGDGAVTLRQGDGADSNLDSEDGNTILLIAILGSVGLICIAVVILGLAIVTTKKRRNKANSITATHIPTGENTIFTGMKNPSYESYETVGPALPDRPPIRHAPSPKTLDSIYEPEPDGKQNDYFEPKQSLDAENYLLPLAIPYTSSDDLSTDEEAIYCNIDETKR